MASDPTSRVDRAIASMRSATTDYNPFTTLAGGAIIPDPEARAKAGAASVELLQGLATLVEVTFDKFADGVEAGAELGNLLVGLGGLIRQAAYLDSLDDTL